ncbi:EEF1A lysine methyltransferase 2 isoform X1 [Rhinolophus ferrumequinum]|uniref:EEF1A lysine methyltransferase 2 n=5 Tax=Rhinolophus ferrumequinum TaxID=59479 RepID=A0A671EHF2_RHIFE|nr:EEF1A lysine methyltransferase 2 isoform X1 [Rhinolophus ferrumequinum]
MAAQRLCGEASGMNEGSGGGGGRCGGIAVRFGGVSPGGDGFAPSALGTREHWDAVYERELHTFQEYGDKGEIWFGEESMNRLIRWMQKHKIPLDASILDIGTGNGVFLVELAKFGFSNITGIDYSPSAIQLSGSIIEKEGLSSIKLKVEDFLNLSTKLSGFHICIDKGTFDAISLNPDNAIEKRKQYVKSLSRVLKVKGFFLITSCNWTKEELLNEFSEGFELFEELPTPKFNFGGRSGNSVAALVFQKTELTNLAIFCKSPPKEGEWLVGSCFC